MKKKKREVNKMLKDRQLMPVIVENDSDRDQKKLTPEQELKLVRSSIRKSCKESENVMKQELNRNGEILVENISAISMSLIDGSAAKEMIGQSAKEFVRNDTAIEVTDQGILKTIQGAKNLLKL